jgi:cytochrome P450
MTAPTTTAVGDYDLFDPAYIDNPFPVWERLRERCPVARSDASGGSWMVTRYDDVVAVAHDTGRFSSSSVSVVPRPEEARAALPAGSPPITCDPPHHRQARRPLSSWFSPRRVAELEPFTRAMCRNLLAEVVSLGRCDGARDYARHIPVGVLGPVLGVPDEQGPRFVALVQDLFCSPDDERRIAAVTAIATYFGQVVDERRKTPGPDLISGLLHGDASATMSTQEILGAVSLILVAGIDTAASVLGSALWHLATHADDRRRLVAEPELIPVAVEEFLRAFSPATMGRITTEDVVLGDRLLSRGDRVLLNFAAANRDERAFPAAATVVLDRQDNRHLAFGSGIHRCLGAHLARMELRVALGEWLQVVPDFRLDPEQPVVWTGGQVRGPQSLPLVFAG